MERFPGLVTDRSAWRGADLSHSEEWVFGFGEKHLAELDAALARVRHLPVEMIARTDFPLPTLAGLIAQFADELENGRGLILFRGFPVERYSEEDGARIFWGFGSHFGSAISQNKFGQLLGHVRDEGAAYGTRNARGYNSSARLKFHNDNADVVALLCYHPAKEGGLSTVTSATAIYNEIVRRRPDLLDQYYQGMHYHLRGEERPNIPPVTPHRIPIFSYCADKLSCRYVRNAINLAPKEFNTSHTERELETLDLFDELAASADLRLDMELQPGDMQYLNNHVTVHSRTAFVDHDDPKRRRHLLRLWLNLYNGRLLAPEFANRYGSGAGRLGVPPVPGLASVG
ncbi:MAG: TauD/TfdA family dioxygenase [Proteobacteria bacterium]|nr:TauD/TfdA family dioxygenase [Pseudomonadota bacterium]